MIHHFFHKGHTIDYLVNLSEDEKMFAQASMELHFDEEKAKYST